MGRHLGMNYRTAWLVHNKIIQAMKERDGADVLRGKVQVDDASLGGERCGGKPGRGSENKMPILAAVPIDDGGQPRYVKLATVATFSIAAIADWAQDSLAIGCKVISDGLACFRAVTEVGCLHQAVVMKGRHPATPSMPCKSIRTLIATWVLSITASTGASTWQQ